jgi:L-ascorbate metabolism protein UlaG (beta-lactamase superfamily)
MKRHGIAAALLPLALGLGASFANAADQAAMVKARQKFFGVENVDANTGAVKKDKVIASWATNTTYVTSILGRVVLLDSYISRPELPTAPIDRRYSPLLPQDLIDVQPEAIFLGHGHGDHADNAAYIAKWTNATIYATPETCDVMQQDVARMAADPNPQNGGVAVVPNANPVNCVGVVPRGSRPGQYDQGPNAGLGKSSATKLSTPLDPLVCVLAFKFIHSGTAPVDPSFPHTTLFDLGDPRYPGRDITTPPPAISYPAMYPTLTPFTPPATGGAVAGQLNTTTTGFGGTAGAYEVFYQFVLRGGYNFSLVWLNSAGPAKEGIGVDPGLVTLAQYNDPTFPQANKDLARAIGNSLYSLMDTLPATDVLLGSIVSLGAANNQQRDIILVQEHLKPKVYIPGHLTDVAQKGSAIYHMMSWQQTALNMGYPQSEWPEFRLLIDPVDFLVPQVWSPGDPRWFQASKGARVAQLCQ